MKCRVDDALLQRFFDDEVMRWERDLVEVELARCAECRRRIRELRMIRRVLKEAIEPISVSSQSSAVWARVQSRLGFYPESHSHHRHVQWRHTVVVVLAVTVLLFSLVVNRASRQGGDKNINRSASWAGFASTCPGDKNRFHRDVMNTAGGSANDAPRLSAQAWK